MGNVRWAAGVLAALVGSGLGLVACSSSNSGKPGASAGSAGAGGGSSGSSGSLAGAGGRAGSAGVSGEGGSGGKPPSPPLHVGITTPMTGTFTDARDNTTYAWVELNGVRWMAENLRFKLPDGDIETCFYDAVSQLMKCDQYGYFYGWSAALGEPLVANYLALNLPDGSFQGACPVDWHLPSTKEWTALFDYVDSAASAPAPTMLFGDRDYSNLAEPFRSTDLWDAGNGTNELLFNAKPFQETSVGLTTAFWAADELNYQNGTIVYMAPKDIDIKSDFKFYRYAVRCVSGKATAAVPTIQFPAPANTSGTFTDARDNTAYATTVIGTQTWMAQNLNFDAGKDSFCYANQPDHCRLFGHWYSFDSAQTVCPTGFHLPTVDEWITLGTAVDMQTGKAGATVMNGSTSFAIGQSLINSVLWPSPPMTDPPFGFNALPGGSMLNGTDDGNFPDQEAIFWTASKDTDGNQIIININPQTLYSMAVIDGVDASVRCVKN